MAKAGRKQLSITERYNKYLKQLAAREQWVRKRLKTPATTANITPYTQKQFEEIFTGRLADYTGKAGAKYTNVLKQIVSAQIYGHTMEEAKSLRQFAEGLGIDVKDYSVVKLRSDKAKFNELLSKLNTQMKASGYAITGTERANYISYIFGS